MSKKPIELAAHNKNLNQLKRDLATFRENLPVHLEYAEIMAKITKAKYTSLIKEGFSKEEALELCKGILHP